MVGLEEMVDLTATTVVLESQSQKRAAVWVDMVNKALNRTAKSEVVMSSPSHSQETTYVLVEQQILVGVFLCVYVRKSLRERVQDVMSSGVVLLSP